jgi:addiction module RelE/StbE family toxin
MAAKIVWSKNALQDLENVKKYLEQNWPPKVLISFLDKLITQLKLLETFPELGRASSAFSNRRRIVITKHNLLVYSLQNEEIVIEAIWDTRQNDIELKF